MLSEYGIVSHGDIVDVDLLSSKCKSLSRILSVMVCNSIKRENKQDAKFYPFDKKTEPGKEIGCFGKIVF